LPSLLRNHLLKIDHDVTDFLLDFPPFLILEPE
jgi:hypothetical protein